MSNFFLFLQSVPPFIEYEPLKVTGTFNKFNKLLLIRIYMHNEEIQCEERANE